MKFKRKEESEHKFPDGTLCYEYNGLFAALIKENGFLKLTLSHKSRLPLFREIELAKYELCPEEVYMAQIYPPKGQYVSTFQNNCIHLIQITPNYESAKK